MTVLIHLRPDFAPFWVRLVRATAEAAMVGGLADWFAVTALFRHPLGIPIPHTAIVANRKDRIGRSLGNFVGNNFLAREVIARQLAGMQLGERAARWLSEPAHQARVARAIARRRGARRRIGAGRRAAGAACTRTLVAQLRKAQVAPLLGDLLTLMATTDDRHQEMLDRLVRAREPRRARQQGAHPRAHRRGEPVVGAERRWTTSSTRRSSPASSAPSTTSSANDAHPLRAQFDHALRDFTDKLHNSPETIARAEAMKERLLAHPGRRGALGRAARRGAAVAREVRRPRRALPRAAGARARRHRRAALANEQLLQDIDEALERLVLGVVDQYRPEVAELIARTVEGWDATDASRKIEVQIGRDLQFIRINGTLVGGLVGLVLVSRHRAHRLSADISRQEAP